MANPNLLFPTPLIPDDAPLLGKDDKTVPVPASKKFTVKFDSKKPDKYFDLHFNVDLSGAQSGPVPGMLDGTIATLDIKSKNLEYTFVPPVSTCLYQVRWKSEGSAGMTFEYAAFPS